MASILGAASHAPRRKCDDNEYRYDDGGCAVPAELIEADLDMLVLTGGRERTGSEMHQLCASAGFKEINVIPMNYPWAIVEAVRKA